MTDKLDRLILALTAVELRLDNMNAQQATDRSTQRTEWKLLNENVNRVLTETRLEFRHLQERQNTDKQGWREELRALNKRLDNK